MKKLFKLLLASLTISQSYAQNTTAKFNMTQGVTEISKEVYDLHMTIFYICCIIGIVVFGAMFYAMFKFQKKKGAVPSKFDENVKLEVAWTIVPFLILIGMAIPASKTLMSMERIDGTPYEIVKITGSRWKWGYEYPNSNIKFISNMKTGMDEVRSGDPTDANYMIDVDRRLVLPANKKVRLLLTSDDVVHSWWVPDFAVKKDAIPGYINSIDINIQETGTYFGKCTELCGMNHAYMPVAVDVVEVNEYEAWRTEQIAKLEEKPQFEELTFAETMERGKQGYTQYCSVCHQPTGEGLQGIFPALNHSAIATQKEKIEEHIHIVLKGRKAMPSFKHVPIDVLSQIITYERNAWDNHTEDFIKPQDLMTHDHSKHKHYDGNQPSNQDHNNHGDHNHGDPNHGDHNHGDHNHGDNNNNNHNHHDHNHGDNKHQH